MKTKILTGSMITVYALLNTPAFAEEVTLDPIVVSADFREEKLSETTNSVTVIGEEEIYDKASAPFEEVIGKAPNVNFTGVGSRAHHIQIRGIGERSQFKYPLNPSVGITIDGMDFSDTTLAVTLFDVNQIEVLKGPQGTTFGSNGMAGVINVQSNEPTRETEGHVEATVGNYNTKAFGLAVGGEISENLLGRFSIHKNTSDGFMENIYLGRDDTNNIDELAAKMQLRWFAADNHTIDFKFMHLDIDNGYNAFTLDNSRKSIADVPGNDEQKTNALLLKSTYDFGKSKLISSINWSDNDTLYVTDYDWAYPGYNINGGEQYDGYDSFDRNRKNLSIDVRFVSDEKGKIFNNTTDWTIGAYYQDRKHTLDNFYYYSEPGYAEYKELSTKYDTKATALYGQLDTVLTDKLTLITGLRVEKWDAQYSDHKLYVADYSPDTITEVSRDYDDTLYGGKIGLNYQVDKNTLIYTALSKGYKPGGVNVDPSVTDDLKTYETEELWNLEAGINSSHFDNKLYSRLNVFYAKRRDQQVDTSDQIGADYVEYLVNAGKSYNYGLESEIDYYPKDSLHLYSRIGLLQTEYDEFPTDPSLEGRGQPQAPNYQYNIGLNYNFAENWAFNTNIEGKDSYYFTNSTNQKINGYDIVNASLLYTRGNWSANIWVKNITDEDYPIKAFYWDNTSADGWDDPQVYVQYGSPRTFGLTVSYDF
ncbi:TonB-dependent receptor [Sulfurovum sp. AR]|uniref:TonB-dependent receptor n=1 Tax=Sulfurovum sp. AR TaxID=1165841 RepID=UPI00025C49A4|nr:TonB-dependent receptor [Sulfurovum sp. AR]EIF50155.1 TonB-dependent receptor [Sulfurovum sp. AR]